MEAYIFKFYIYFLIFIFNDECRIHSIDERTDIQARYSMKNYFEIETLQNTDTDCLTNLPCWNDKFVRKLNNIKQKGKAFVRERRSGHSRPSSGPPMENTSNQNGRYPTEDDRNMVNQALNDLNLTVGNLYKILQMDHLYCPDSFTCTMAPRMNISDLHPSFKSCCDQCSCHEDCYLYESCCADAQTVLFRSNTECVLPQYLPLGMSEVDQNYRMKATTKCKSEMKKREREACERPEGIVNSLEGSQPVYSNGMIYRNRFCALCNSVSESEILVFPARVQCPSSESLYASTIPDLLRKLKLEKRCNVVYEWPKIIALRTLEEQHKCKTGLIRTCNVTGKWHHYDKNIEMRCTSYTHVYGNIYRNIFCYICNNNIDPVMSCDITDKIDDTKWGSFTAMLHFSEDNHEVNNMVNYGGHMCKSNEMMDVFTRKCVFVECSIPFAFDNMRKACSKVYEDVVRMYELFVHVTEDGGFDADGLFLKMKDFLSRGGIHWKYYWLRVYRVPHLSSLSTTHTIYHMVYLDYDSLHRINHVLNISNYIKIALDTALDAKILTGHVYEDIQDYSSYTFPYDGRRLRRLFSSHDKSLINTLRRYDIQRTSRLLVCPYINLQNYTTILKKSTYELCIVELDICFQQPDFKRSSGDSYHVCIDIFERKMKELKGTEKSRLLANVDELEGNISLVCTCISISSLLYVATTFVLFKSLRTFPGKLMMILVFSLLAAHLLYQFGMFQTKHPIVCRLLGILIHFSWLWVMFWMNVSCFHMTSVFSRVLPTEINTRSRLANYIIYSFLCSSAFVGINIVVNHFQGKGIGYGVDICWISRHELVGYVFALPLGLVILSNLLMFLGVAITLYRRPNLQSSKHRNRQDFIIFIKLTSITGISWVFGFLYEWLRIKPFSYLFIVFTGLQGLYLMVAFSCNSRVRRLYAESLPNSRSKSDSQPSVYHVTNT